MSKRRREANGIRRVVEARRKDLGRDTTAAQEQGKKGCFIERKRRRKRRENGRRNSWKEEGERKKRALKRRENRRRKGVRKITTSGSEWCLTWRQVANTSRLPTHEPRLRRS